VENTVTVVYRTRKAKQKSLEGAGRSLYALYVVTNAYTMVVAARYSSAADGKNSCQTGSPQPPWPHLTTDDGLE